MLNGNVSGGNHSFRENSYKLWQKSHLNSQKNHTCRWYDDTQLYKISCPNSTSFVRYKNNKFVKKSSEQLSNLKFVVFISHKRSRVWKRYFTRLCIIISSTCVFFCEFKQHFYHDLHRFSRSCVFHPICSLLK